MNEYIVRITWDDSFVSSLVEAETAVEAARIVATDNDVPIGTPVSVRAFIPARTVEDSGTVTVRNANQAGPWQVLASIS